MPPKSFISILLSSEGIIQSRMISNQNTCTLSLGQMSISSASIVCGGNSDSITNLHEPDVPEVAPNIDKWIADAETASPVTYKVQTQNECANDVIKMEEKILENYCSLKIGSINSKNNHVNITCIIILQILVFDVF